MQDSNLLEVLCSPPSPHTPVAMATSVCHCIVCVCVWGGWYGAYLTLMLPSPALFSRLQELYYEIVNVLSLMLEDLPKKSSSSSL